jgi:hypothetical protein
VVGIKKNAEGRGCIRFQGFVRFMVQEIPEKWRGRGRGRASKAEDDGEVKTGASVEIKTDEGR